MITPSDSEWVGLLHVAKEIRRSVRPVHPSPGFRRHLRSDLATALGAEARVIDLEIAARRRWSPLVLGGCLGLTAVALALILLRGNQANRQTET